MSKNQSKHEPKNKAKFWKKTEHVLGAIAIAGIITVGSDVYRIGTGAITGPPQLSQEYTTLRDKSYKLEADRQLLSTELTTEYPSVSDENFFNYAIARMDFLKQNEISREQTQQRLSELKIDNEIVAQYRSDSKLSRYTPIGFGLIVLGLMGVIITSSKHDKYREKQSLERKLT